MAENPLYWNEIMKLINSIRPETPAQTLDLLNSKGYLKEEFDQEIALNSLKDVVVPFEELNETLQWTSLGYNVYWALKKIEVVE